MGHGNAMSLLKKNMQIVNLGHAMLGAVSPNLRRVALEFRGSGAMRLLFVLERDATEDREEIEDIVFRFEALQKGFIDLDVVVTVDDRPGELLSLPGRLVFARKE